MHLDPVMRNRLVLYRESYASDDLIRDTASALQSLSLHDWNNYRFSENSEDKRETGTERCIIVAGTDIVAAEMKFAVSI